MAAYTPKTNKTVTKAEGRMSCSQCEWTAEAEGNWTDHTKQAWGHMRTHGAKAMGSYWTPRATTWTQWDGDEEEGS